MNNVFQCVWEDIATIPTERPQFYTSPTWQRNISLHVGYPDHRACLCEKKGRGGNGDCYFKRRRKLVVHQILCSPDLDRFSLAIRLPAWNYPSQPPLLSDVNMWLVIIQAEVMGVTFRPKDIINHKALEIAEPQNEAICRPESLHGWRWTADAWRYLMSEK